jgi:hypothetical protein
MCLQLFDYFLKFVQALLELMLNYACTYASLFFFFLSTQNSIMLQKDMEEISQVQPYFLHVGLKNMQNGC